MMAEDLSWLLVTGAVIVAAFSLLWLVSLMLRNASIVDPFWGCGFILIACATTFMTETMNWRGELILLLTVVWGIRLSLYLLWRNWGHGEDRRYAAMRAYHGARFWWISLGTVFLLQAAVAWLVSLPLQWTIKAGSSTAFGWLDAVGLLLWGIGMFFEAVGDWQLARFRADPRNAQAVMDRGLWRYTRHPNYFGECCIWWGFYLLAAAAGFPWTIFSPLLMTWLLLKVSGVSLLERTITDRRPEYAAYQQRTSPFFPWPPQTATTTEMELTSSP